MPALGEGAPATAMADGYSGASGLVLRGRVVDSRHFDTERPLDSTRTNVKRTLMRLEQRELPGTTVSLEVGQASVSVQTDDEGRFAVTLAPGPLAPGWQVLTVRPAPSGPARFFVPHPDNRYVFVSDVDDTVLWSEVNNKARLLRHSLMENSLQRRGFPGTADFYRLLSRLDRQPAFASWFYLSASPQQLAEPLQTFLEREGLPAGVLLLKTFAWTGGDPWLDQQRYKTSVLDNLLREYPDRQFVLIGDDGERDPEIYRDLALRYPDRVALILIRRVHPDAQRPRPGGQCDLVAAQTSAASCPALQALLAP